MTAAALAALPRAPERGERFRWLVAALVALALHAAAAVVLLTGKTPVQPIALPQAAVLLDLAPLSAPAPPAVAPPPPEPLPPEPPVLTEPLPTVAAPAPPAPLPPQRKPRPPVQRPQPHRTKAPPQPRPVAEPAAPAAVVTPQPALRPATSVAAPTPPSDALPSFESRLYAYLEQYKRYPRAAQARGEQGTAYLRFTMDRQGKVLAYKLERSSGHELLDQEVLAMIQRAEPLPAIPATILRAPLEIAIPIEFALH